MLQTLRCQYHVTNVSTVYRTSYQYCQILDEMWTKVHWADQMKIAADSKL